MDAGEEGFLSRWSRLKAARGEPEEPPEGEPAKVQPPQKAMEVPDLPALDTLHAGSDFTVFMREHVPVALRLAALRKAWAGNPVIAGHRPLVDYDWDHAATGYGRLLPTDDAKKMVAGFFSHLEESRPEPNPAPADDHAPESETEERLAEADRLDAAPS